MTSWANRDMEGTNFKETHAPVAAQAQGQAMHRPGSECLLSAAPEASLLLLWNLALELDLRYTVKNKINLTLTFIEFIV